MKKYFVVSDVHSFYDKLMPALTEAGFDINNPEHILINCGDAVDRGLKPKEVLQFLVDMSFKNRAILIRGNHEDLMEQAIARHYFQSHDYHNRTVLTAELITNCTVNDYGDDAVLSLMKENELWHKYVNACVNYAEIGNYIFVHGWIPTKLVFGGSKPTKYIYMQNWRDAADDRDWYMARWTNGMGSWSQGVREPNKTVVCGHWHTSWGHCNLHNDGEEFLSHIETYYINPETGRQEPHENFDIFYDKGIIAIDACTAHSGKVNVLVLDEAEM